MSEEKNNQDLKLVKGEEESEPAKTDKKKDDTPVEASEPAPPSTNYELKMSQMTPEVLAAMSVQLVQVNGEHLFWLTSVGQLYSFQNRQQALIAEYAWLMSEPNKN